MDFTIEEYNEVIHLTIIEETDTLEFSIEETVEELNLVIEEYHGADGAKGDKPNHQWNGTSLRFENPDDTWGNYVDLKGDKGDYGGGLMSVVAGDNITIDNTDPLNPIINAEDGGTTVTKTSDLVNDGADGVNPYISLNDIPEVDISTKAEVDASNLTPTNVINWRDALSVYSKSQVDGFVSTLSGSITANTNSISDLNVHQIVINTSASITTNTVGSVTGKSQHGRNVRIDNGVHAINLSCLSTSNADFIASYTHWGTADITFTNGSGVTLNDMTGTNKILKAGGSATLERYGNIYRLRISNI